MPWKLRVKQSRAKDETAMVSDNLIKANDNGVVKVTDIGIFTYDSKDVDNLSNFGIPILSHEITASHKRERYYFDDHDTASEIFERDFQAACQLAINLIRSREPKPTVATNNKYVDIDDLKSHVDIVEVTERYTHLVKAGKNFHGICPFHSEKKPSFFVYPEQQTWHCFGACNIGGDVISLVMKAENVDFKSAIAALGGVR